MRVEIQHGSNVRHRHAGTYVFVVSHMRSFSSLLCHILGSHPDISGYGETHQTYLGRNDLDRLARAVREQTGEPSLHRILVDKILHNHVEIAPSILGRPDVRVLFLLRNAPDTLASLVDIARKVGRTGRFSDPKLMLDYYVTRLKEMERYGSLVQGDAHYVASERLVGDTDAVLDGLTRWLGLDPALTPEYRTFPLTGAPGRGDVSPYIRAGRVVASADERHRDYVDTPIDEDLIRRGQAAYDACRAALAHVRGSR